MKILLVSSNSTSRPIRVPASTSVVMNAVMSEARAACCMLWVTITIVYWFLISSMRSSILAVAIGSRAEQGSSMRITSGSTASAARDAEALLLTARQREGALLQLVLDLVEQSRASERALDDLVETLALAEETRAERDVVVDRLRERVRLLEDHADAAPDLDRIDLGPVEVDAVVGEAAVHAAPRTRSFIRLKHRMSVLLPQPDGPIRAVISPGADVERHALDRRHAAVLDRHVAHAEDDLGSRCGLGARRLLVVDDDRRLHDRVAHGSFTPGAFGFARRHCTDPRTVDLVLWHGPSHAAMSRTQADRRSRRLRRVRDGAVMSR